MKVRIKEIKFTAVLISITGAAIICPDQNRMLAPVKPGSMFRFNSTTNSGFAGNASRLHKGFAQSFSVFLISTESEENRYYSY